MCRHCNKNSIVELQEKEEYSRTEKFASYALTGFIITLLAVIALSAAG